VFDYFPSAQRVVRSMATNQCLVTHARSLLVDKGAFFYTPEMTWSRSALSSFHGLDLFLSGCELYFD
jgi:hypothetical protein